MVIRRHNELYYTKKKNQSVFPLFFRRTLGKNKKSLQIDIAAEKGKSKCKVYFSLKLTAKPNICLA